ncbi:hypothetical protein J2Z48_002123 [Croceifilum oryzae]|uniref:Uncharacterized protein n=1 Tax=Croceifilum oryzae TaxID=1553429 RepID=A0AAJ1TG89_9BACL|nr:transposase [Croceifilum oryzae]MDQ0417939.1 hypothetical protein [Croceifilum oryzae]
MRGHNPIDEKMNLETLIKSLYKQLINDSCAFYQDMFINRTEQDVTDPYWKESLKMFANLSNEDRKTFFKVIEQVQVDSMSEILGILDGVVWVDGDVKFNVTLGDGGIPINGELQELFLAYDEEKRPRNKE